MANENDALEPHRGRVIRNFLKGRDENAPEVVAFWRVIYRHRTDVDHGVALAVATELADCRLTVGDVLGGWQPRRLRKNWHADGCPGAEGCNCGGGLTDDELFAKAKP